VSNDRFRDYIKQLEDSDLHYRPRLIKQEKRWLKETRMSFEFDDKREFKLVKND
jgi:hypothetical protein